MADILNIRIGNSFSGGLIDYLLFGVLQGNDSTNWIRVLPLGLIWAAIYYIIFRFAIRKLKVAIPGSEVMDDIENETTVTETATTSGGSTLENEAYTIIHALGEAENIENVTACATRLRVSVKDNQMIDKAAIQRLGATAVFEVDGGVQAVFGGKANILSQEINQILGTDD